MKMKTVAFVMSFTIMVSIGGCSSDSANQTDVQLDTQQEETDIELISFGFTPEWLISILESSIDIPFTYGSVADSYLINFEPDTSDISPVIEVPDNEGVTVFADTNDNGEITSIAVRNADDGYFSQVALVTMFIANPISDVYDIADELDISTIPQTIEDTKFTTHDGIEYFYDPTGLMMTRTEYTDYNTILKTFNEIYTTEEDDKIDNNIKAAPESLESETEMTPSSDKETTVEDQTETEKAAGIEEQNALRSALDYLDFTSFSYSGLVDQLEYEGYSTEAATYAADNCGADWNEQALQTALDYLDYSAFSYTGLIDQLEYEGFTSNQATYAVDNCNADWNEQAAKKAQDYIDYSSFSRQGLIDQLIYEGFTAEQAEYGVSAVGY